MCSIERRLFGKNSNWFYGIDPGLGHLDPGIFVCEDCGDIYDQVKEVEAKFLQRKVDTEASLARSAWALNYYEKHKDRK